MAYVMATEMLLHFRQTSLPGMTKGALETFDSADAFRHSVSAPYLCHTKKRFFQALSTLNLFLPLRNNPGMPLASLLTCVNIVVHRISSVKFEIVMNTSE
jgi:hypothetical protein